MQENVEQEFDFNFDFKAVEAKWQREWFERKVFEPRVEEGKKKFFFTVPYPYVSGSLHVGHGRTYANGDVITRFKRMQGFNVLWPMGFHITGTPVLAVSARIAGGDAETIKLYEEYVSAYEPDQRKVKRIVQSFKDPKRVVEFFSSKLVQDFKRMGFSLDLSRQFTTGDPEYNKFIEWQFLKYKEKNYLKQAAYPILYCVVDKNAVGEDDIRDGDINPVEVMRFTGIKTRFDDGFIISATLRSETVFGITNLFVNPKAVYVKARVNGEVWFLSKRAAEKLVFQQQNVEVLEELSGEHFVGKRGVTPLGASVLILPASFVDAENASGFVHSVPSHAPYDWAGIIEARSDKKLFEKMPWLEKEIAAIQPIHLIDSGEGESPAVAACERARVKNARDKTLLDKLTQEIYKKEFYEGVLNEACGEFAGLKVSEAKDKIAEWLKARGAAIDYFETSRPAECRCGGKVVAAVLPDQWFLDFKAEGWKKRAFEALKRLTVFPENYKKLFYDVFEWLDKRPCARRRGLGTQLPFANEWIIESLSDSTIYMAFYTIIKKIREHEIKPTQLKPEFFDYVFLGKGPLANASRATGIPEKALEDARKEFLYWYPNDLRHTGIAHIQNHLSFFIFAHAAIFDEEHWPKAITLNNLVISERTKMSKSKGNVVTLDSIAKDYGADLFRLYAVGTADFASVLDFRKKDIQATRRTLNHFIATAQKLVSATKNQPTQPTPLTQWAVSVFETTLDKSTRALQEFRLRDYVQTAFYKQLNAFERFLERASQGEQALVARETALRWIALLTPLVPHACEELWARAGQQPFASLSRWPAARKEFINPEAEAAEEYVEAVASDVRALCKLLKAKQAAPTRATLVVASRAKMQQARELLEESASVAELRSKPGDAKLKAWLEKRFFELRARPQALELSEFEVLNASKQFLSKQLELEVVVEREEESASPRASRAMPGKPAVVLE